MSELINKNDNRATIRWKLLTGVSALALTAYVSSSAVAKAEDANQPQMWIELGGQLTQLRDKSDFFVPDFPTTRPSVLTPSQKFEKAPSLGFDEEGKISFRPDNSDWILSASIRYGRSLKSEHVRQQTHPGNQAYCLYPTLPTPYPCYSASPRAARFADTTSRNSEQHTILDFQAGKDVGLGLFGKNASSTVNIGVRFAQFRDKSNISLKSDPDWRFQPKYYYYYTSRKLEFLVQPYHSNAATFRANRSFSGIGPSLSWTSSLPFAGNAQDGELDLDWSANAALLFGRQRTQLEHKTKVLYNDGGLGFLFGHGTLVTATQVTPPPKTRSRNVTVPNVGGSVGLSWRLQNFKVSFGYKADFFFNAIDGGIDTRKNENRGFFGPYASVSVGLGD